MLCIDRGTFLESCPPGVKPFTNFVWLVLKACSVYIGNLNVMKIQGDLIAFPLYFTQYLIAKTSFDEISRIGRIVATLSLIHSNSKTFL